ncbi:MAG: hypothetical protein SLRJCFUN_001509 [Candidatus Fervidibacter sp.]
MMTKARKTKVMMRHFLVVEYMLKNDRNASSGEIRLYDPDFNQLGYFTKTCLLINLVYLVVNCQLLMSQMPGNSLAL